MTAAPPAPAAPSLELSGVSAAYDGNVVVRNVSVSVPQGSVVALLGANGAGKTTLLRVASGLMSPKQGSISMFGDDVTREGPSQRAQRGMCIIPEGRGIFRSLSVAENLLLLTPPWVREDRIARAIEVFPVLGSRLKQTAGKLSGGQQQMLALARIYLAQPRVALLDELSLGLAPIIIDEIFATLADLAKEGIALLIVEQYINRVLEMCDQVYVLNRGDIAYSGPPGELDQRVVLEGYLGTKSSTT